MTSPDHSHIAADAEWLPHRFDWSNDRIRFIRVGREAHRAATFLIDDHLGPRQPVVEMSRADALAGAGTAGPLHFIFHSAFCCSTLMARACDLPGVAMGLKEPVILNDLSGWRRRGGTPAEIARGLDAALTLLARPFSEGEIVVVKPSNVINALIPAMLGLRPNAGALLLYAPLRTYLASIAKKEMEGRLWVRDLFVKLAGDGLADLGFSSEDYMRQTDLQIAAVGWLAQQALFDRVLRNLGPSRALALDSEALVAMPREASAAMFRLFGRPLSDHELDSLIADGTFSRHSKSDTAFSRESRLAEHAASVAVHAEEVEKVAAWAEAVAEARQIPLRLEPAAIA